jgi:hypothetical protein
LPTDHWANDYIYELYATGAWGRWSIDIRPWYRGDIRERVERIARADRAGTRPLSERERWLLLRLRSEFDLGTVDSAAVDPAASDDALEYRIGASPGVTGRLERYDDPLLRSRLAAFAGAGRGSWWVRVRGDIDSHGDLDPTFFGREWKGNLTGTIDLATFSLRRGSLELLVGRDFIRWGPSAYDALLVNDQSPPFNLLRFAYRHRWFDFHYFFTGLDDDFRSPLDTAGEYIAPYVKRYLAGHRLQIHPWRTLEIGFSEVVLWGGPYRQVEAYYLNPFLPFYWEQLNNNEDDNPLWSLDISYVVPSGPMLYGEWLIDDFQIDFRSEIHQIGGLLGFSWPDIAGLAGSFVTVEWARIESTVYGQNRPYNRYLNRRVGIGSVIGPDADRWYLRWRQHLTPSAQVDVSGTRMRKGENEITTPQIGAIRPGHQFPTGVVARTIEAQLAVRYQPDAHLWVAVSGGYRWQRNFAHVEGADRDGAFGALSLELSGWRLGRL